LSVPLKALDQSTQRRADTTSLSDHELVKRLINGCTKAFEELFSRYHYRIFNLAYRMTGNYQEAQDLTQDTFVRVLENRHTVKNTHSFSSWLYRIATNLCLDERRKHKRAPIQLEQSVLDMLPKLRDPKPGNSPDKSYEIKENQGVVWEVASRLPPHYRLVLTLRELHGLKYAKIAEIMNTSVSAIETMLFRARKKFKIEYDKVADATHPKICGEMGLLISALLDGELTTEKQSLVEKHLASCAKCQVAHADMKKTAKLYKSLVPVLPPAVLRTSLLAQSAHLLASPGAQAAAGVANTATQSTAGFWARLHTMMSGKALPVIASGVIMAALLGNGAVKLLNKPVSADNRTKEKASLSYSKDDKLGTSSASPVAGADHGRDSLALRSSGETGSESDATEAKSDESNLDKKSDNEGESCYGTQGSNPEGTYCTNSPDQDSCGGMTNSTCCESTKDCAPCSGMEQSLCCESPSSCESSSSCESPSSCDGSKSVISGEDEQGCAQPKDSQDKVSADLKDSNSEPQGDTDNKSTIEGKQSTGTCKKR